MQNLWPLLSSKTAKEANSILHMGTKQFRCPHCKKEFVSRQNLKGHKTKVNHTIRYYDYNCDLCDKNFFRNPHRIRLNKQMCYKCSVLYKSLHKYFNENSWASSQSTTCSYWMSHLRTIFLSKHSLQGHFEVFHIFTAELVVFFRKNFELAAVPYVTFNYLFLLLRFLNKNIFINQSIRTKWLILSYVFQINTSYTTYNHVYLFV